MENMYTPNMDGEKQHINLSIDAWAVIDDDMRNFYTYKSKQSFSGFMNTVFINFYERAEATFSAWRNVYREELKDELVGLPRQSDIISRLVDAHIKKLKKNIRKYQKGTGRKFRLNKESQCILDEHPDSSEYESRGDYLKAVFEQYATLPAYMREQVFFKDRIDNINNAIASGTRIQITLLPTAEIGGAKRTFSVKPYDIRQDKMKMFNYLVGFSEMLDAKHEPVTAERITCFRISRIKDIRVTAQKSFISKPKRDEIEKEIREKGVQFMSGDLIDVTVEFTKKGFDDFNRQSYMRPPYYEKIESAENTYVFHCTEFQALNYFFRLGADARVLSPASLRDSLRIRFENAARAYGEIED